MTPPKLLIAKGWKAVIRADLQPGMKSRLLISIGHPEIPNHSNIQFDLTDLTRGVEIDIGRMMDIALGIPDEKSRG